MGEKEGQRQESLSLGVCPQENQAVHDELRRAVEERESLKLKVQEYAQSVLRYEEAIRVKVTSFVTFSLLVPVVRGLEPLVLVGIQSSPPDLTPRLSWLSFQTRCSC